MQGPSEAFASVLTHPLEEPLPVVADCSLSTSNTGRAAHLSISTPAAYAGWSQERVVWSSRQLHFVATHNEVRGVAALLALHHGTRSSDNRRKVVGLSSTTSRALPAASYTAACRTVAGCRSGTYALSPLAPTAPSAAHMTCQHSAPLASG